MKFSNGLDDAAQPRPLQIVLAEDDSDQRLLLAAMLRADGDFVTEVGDGEGMLKQLRALISPGAEGSPDVVAVCDYRLKNSDALSVLHQLRAEGRMPRFLLITAFWSSQLYNQAKDLGALAVFAKPFDFEDLRIVVRYLRASAGNE